MGMYTEINIGVRFKKDTPDNIIDILKYMVGDIDELKTTLDHPLFSTPRWWLMLKCDSYYFDFKTDSSLTFDNSLECWYLNVRSDFKNYYDEIRLFMDFISPYLNTTGFIGYYRYEEDDDPTLIYNDYGTIRYKNHIN